MKVPCAWILKETASDSLGATGKIVGIALLHEDAVAWKEAGRDPWTTRQIYAYPVWYVDEDASLHPTADE